ncbi:MAG TPA: hemerythrin domain-containing protein [Nitrososphaeraceae archaeon]|nr:hemerythrin domain-containing protein [Nitrososphaeraceae archaeon]
MSATKDLKQDHILANRLGKIAKKCSDLLSGNVLIPTEDIKIISMLIQEFVDKFHHGKEEKAYFPSINDKDNYSEDIRKFLIEHELGRRIAKMLIQSLIAWDSGIDSREPVARFLNAYSVFISIHTGKEDVFFDLIEEKRSLSEEEHSLLMEHYKACHSEVGGKVRVEQMTKLIGYLEEREWMRK